MAQAANFTVPTSGPANAAELMAKANESLIALLTANSGTIAPNYPDLGVGSQWLDTSQPLNILKVYDGAQWIAVAAIDPTAHTVVWRGGLLRRTAIDASGTHTWHALTTHFRYFGVAGGGSGGAAASSGATVASAGSGGGAGAYVESALIAKTTENNPTLVVGAAGAAASSSGGTIASGNAGGNSTYSDGVRSHTLNGGGGGGAGAGSTVTGGTGGAGGTGTGTGARTGSAGSPALAFGHTTVGSSTSHCQAGNGADSPMGAGGRGPRVRDSASALENGADASGYGAGGSGSCRANVGNGNSNSGAGAPGRWIIEEYWL